MIPSQSPEINKHYAVSEQKGLSVAAHQKLLGPDAWDSGPGFDGTIDRMPLYASPAAPELEYT